MTQNNKMTTPRPHLFILLALILCARAHAQTTITLKDGRSASGVVISKSDKEILTSIGGKHHTVALEQVQAPDDATLMADMNRAKEAFTAQRHDEATSICTTVLAWSPKHPEAESLLQQVRAAQHAGEVEWLLNDISDRNKAAFCMGRLRQILTIDDLHIVHRKVNKHNNYRVRRESMFLLIPFKSETSVDPLIRQLRTDVEPRNREVAAHALASIMSPRSVPPLIEAMEKDTAWDVRMQAAYTLNRIATPEALTAVQAAATRQENKIFPDHIASFLAENPGYKANIEPSFAAGQVSHGFLNGTKYFVYVSKNYKPDIPAPLLATVHCTDGFGEMYIEFARAQADRYGMIIVAPFFDRGAFYSHGCFNIYNGGQRPDLRLIEIINHVRTRMNIQEDYYIYGHSEGGQFTHRFVLAHPEHIVRAASSGCTYMSQNPDIIFPFGSGPAPDFPDLKIDFGNLVQKNLFLVIGEREDEYHQNEAKRFAAETRAYAIEHNLPYRVRYLRSPRHGHSGPGNWENVHPYLLAGLPPR